MAGALALLTGLVGLTGLACIGAHADLGLGQGGVERLTAYPFPLWISGVGVATYLVWAPPLSERLDVQGLALAASLSYGLITILFAIRPLRQPVVAST